jgi:membrane protein required for colicin V production
LNWIDYGIIGSIGVFGVIGLIRGCAAEAVSLIVWMIAFTVALMFSRDLSVRFGAMIAHESARMVAAFVGLFVLTLILGYVAGLVLRQLVRSTGLSGSDHIAGLFFGIGRGVLLVAIIVILAGLTPLPRNSAWRESNLISPFRSGALWLKKQSSFGIAPKAGY